MNIIRKFIGFVAAVCFVMSLWSTNAFASSKMSYTASCDENISDAEVLSMEGPSVTFEGVLNKNNSGNYAGMLRSGFTTITCVLSGNTAGVPEVYSIHIVCKGTNAVQAIKANNLYIAGDSMYHSKGFFIDGLSSSTGTRTIGSCIIPTSEDEVYVSTNNLKCFFYNEDYWIKFGEIGGWVKV